MYQSSNPNSTKKGSLWAIRCNSAKVSQIPVLILFYLWALLSYRFFIEKHGTSDPTSPSQIINFLISHISIYCKTSFIFTFALFLYYRTFGLYKISGLNERYEGAVIVDKNVEYRRLLS